MDSTLLGLLRQGRGAGFRAAIGAGRSAADGVLDCVLNDPRWDRQVEARDDYYARLLMATGANIDVLGQRVATEDPDADKSDFWLPVGVLAEMCRRGDEAAGAALAEAIAAGPRWRACLDALDAAGGVELIGQVVPTAAVEALVARVGVDDIADAVLVVAAPWDEWAERVSALRFMVGSVASSGREARPMSGPVAWWASRIRVPGLMENLAALSTDELLAYGTTPGAAPKVCDELSRRTDLETLRRIDSVAESGSPEERSVALRALGQRGSTVFLGAAEDFLRWESTLAPAARSERQLRRGYLAYLVELLPTHTLPLARRWFGEPWPLSLAAERILTLHATPDDRQMLESAGAAAMESLNMYRLCSVVEALTTAGPEPSLPFLIDVYDRAPYSYARRRVISALRSCSLTGQTEDYLTESLWDCEPESRELACQALGTANATATRRVAEIASDAFEDDEVREAAQAVLRLEAE
ncbi:MAG: hypothetical protein H6700_02575 [Myxococcales bacterium]|nr:hypothetical protein [Myxococcales bacterium]MCB9519645.1 hypothetical protein [Myxococcales bacterium]MCB9530624.1 hypothetical protein [Myxococcales bacterium]